MKLTIGFSPCPNDTFIFDALVNKKIDTGNLQFELILEDVQTLNEMAIAGKLDITKISYGSLPLVLDEYEVLATGSALGNGVGPLLISPFEIKPHDVQHCTIAIPGKQTTAHILFSLAYPDATNKVFLRYNEIEDFVLSNTGSPDDIQFVKLGVIIHENRFTYKDKGLHKVTDLGSYWEKETGLPIPLGGIVAKRSLTSDVKKNVEKLIGESLNYSYEHEGELSTFVKDNSQEMSEEVMRMHIALYVNHFSKNLGEDGQEAIKKFLNVYSEINDVAIDVETVFLG